jgi:hypothetical protein
MKTQSILHLSFLIDEAYHKKQLSNQKHQNPKPTKRK